MAPIRSGAWLASLAVVAIFAGCSPKPKEPQSSQPPAADPALSLPVAPPALGRAELLAVVGQAASAFATGQATPRGVSDLVGRRFSIRLPFGCFGPQDTGSPRFTYDAEKGTLKLTAHAETWTDVEAIRDLVGTPNTETIEGFWIPRPWIADESCPALRPLPIPLSLDDAAEGQAAASAAFPHTVGLVSTFEAGDSRLQQRGARPYEVVRKIDVPPTGPFRLVLEGRIVEGLGGPIACRADNPDRPPTCLVRVAFDRVAIEGVGGELFGEWR